MKDTRKNVGGSGEYEGCNAHSPRGNDLKHVGQEETVKARTLV